MIYRQKQGFGAPMDEWFREGDFGARCLAAFERSALPQEGFIDGDYFTDLLKDQIAGRSGASFPALDRDERRAVARVLDRGTRGLLLTHRSKTVRACRRRAAQLHEDRAGHARRCAGEPRVRQMLVNTGQHYDEAMAGGFFKELDLPRPIAISASAPAATRCRPRR